MKSANSSSRSRARSGSVRTNEAIAARELKMKCGDICARSALISASISRVRDRSSSDSSSCTETHRATSVAARTSTADSREP